MMTANIANKAVSAKACPRSPLQCGFFIQTLQQEVDRGRSARDESSSQPVVLRSAGYQISNCVSPPHGSTNELDVDRSGIQALSDLFVSEEEWLKSFDLKKHIVQLLVEKVTIDINRQLTVTIHLDLMELLEESQKNSGDSGSSGSWPVSGSPGKSDSHRKPSMFAGRSRYISISTTWNNQ